MSNDLFVTKNINSQELAAWRKQTEKGRTRRTQHGYYWTDGNKERAVSIRRPTLPDAEYVADDTGAVEVEPLSHARRDAREIRDSVLERRIAGVQRLAERSPEFWSTLYDEYIVKHRPDLTVGRTKEEAMRLIMQAQTELSVERVFKRKGRGGGNPG